MFLPRSLINPGPQPSFRILPGGPAASYVASGQLTSAYGVAPTVTRATTKYCTAADGVSVVALASGVPAVEPQGLLIEAAATNLITSSENFSSTWTSGNSTVTQNQATAPDGALTADKIGLQAVPASVSFSELYTSSGFTGTAANYTFSVWLKGDAPGTVWLHLGRASGAGRVSVQCDYTTTWQRFSITTLCTATTWYATIGVYTSMGQSAAAQNVYAWGAQVELGSYPTSYVLTAGSTATRNADGVTFPATALPVTSGFFEFDFTPMWTSQTLASLVDTRNGSFASGVAMYVSGTTLYFVAPSEDATAASASLTWTAGTTYRLRGEFQGGAMRVYRNGVLVGSGNGSATMPSTHSAFRLGSGATGSFHCNGHISNFSCGRL